MFCPECRSEYRQGFTRCSDCDVDLVWELPREEHAQSVPVKIFETGDAALIPVVESLLEGAGIEYEVANRNRPHVFNTQLGYAEIWVRGDEAEAARELLADLSRYDGAQGRE